MNDAVIVSTARTPIGKAYRGAFNNTHGSSGLTFSSLAISATLMPDQLGSGSW